MTTIRTPVLLQEYLKQAPEGLVVHVVGDHKTPEGAYVYLEGLRKLAAAAIHIYDIAWIKRAYPGVLRLNENHDSLRVVGFLEAVKAGAELVVSVDDDNAPQDGFFAVYADWFTGEKGASATDAWESPYTASGYYSRGFPYRHRETLSSTRVDRVQGSVAMHQGLTYGDPDVDALTRFNLAPDLAQDHLPRAQWAVRQFTPINTQNSALRARFVPYWWAPKWCGRHWDIVAGLVVQMLIEMVSGGLVTYGRPFTSSVRNEHDSATDIRDEAIGATIIEDLSIVLDSLREESLDADSLDAAYEILYKALLTFGSRYTYHLGEAMREWHRLLRES